MNIIDLSLPGIRGRLDLEGHLIEAEERLRELNARAGGAIGAPLAVPQLAQVGRLARRLGIPVSRNVIAADGEDDVELLVRAEPDEDGVTLNVSDWRPRSAWRAGEIGPEPAPDVHRSVGHWMWETDAALCITFLSLDAGVRYGFDGNAMFGQPLTRLFALEEDAQGSFPILSAVAMQTRFEGQRAVLRGTGRAVKLSASPRFDAEGRFAGFLGAVEMPAAEPMPPRIDPEIADFGGFPDSFSQRLDRALRLPLGRIVANADSISARTDGPLQADYAEYAADIASAGRHLLALIDDLVDLQAIDGEDFRIASEPIDLADVVRRATGLLAVRAAEADVMIDQPQGDAWLPVAGEYRRALQVMVNLIGNAIRYSPRGGTVWVRLERENGLVHVIVADQGRGIALEDQERIFEKFSRLHPGEQSGSGLGLYIARRLARAMGGDVLVDSAPGMGARFIFSLPVRE